MKHTEQETMEFGVFYLENKHLSVGAAYDTYVETIKAKEPVLLVPELVLVMACRYFDVPVDMVVSKSREVKYLEPRIVASVICRLYITNGLNSTFPYSFEKIGDLLNRDHANIYHHINKWINNIVFDKRKGTTLSKKITDLVTGNVEILNEFGYDLRDVNKALSDYIKICHNNKKIRT